MANCNELLVGLDPTCAGLNKVGGVNKRFWAIQKSNFTYSTGGDGYVNNITPGVTGSITNQLIKFTAKKDKISATWPMTAGDNVNTFNHSFVAPFYTSNPTEQLSVEKLLNADDVVIIYQENASNIRILGLENGLNGSAGEGGSGTILNDNTGYTGTLSGEQTTMPHYFSISPTATLTQNIAYLDALSA